MTAPKPPRPLTRRGRVLIWFMIVFVAMVGVGGGGALIAEGLNGRDAQADGPVGSLTPTDRDCGRDSCAWIGEFVSEDGTITRTGVLLSDAERTRHGDPMPARIDNVRLHDDAGRPTAYTVDYNPGPRMAAGVFVLMFGLVMAALMVRSVRRYKRPAAPPEPAASDTTPPAQA
ncbi:hypothetical protein [Jiangella endophytica]|uniref:hypothetical protein n=1 Tax=Jiangella endophytica TaxID=1623398 RepID=UPI0013007C51|nr:hypothetical protein [Jiangella endophytica]